MTKTRTAGSLMRSMSLRLPLGLHGPVKIDSIEVEDAWTEITYVKYDPNGGPSHTASKRIWTPDPSRITPKDGQTLQEAIDKAWESMLSDLVIQLNYLTPNMDLDKYEISLDLLGVKKIARDIHANKDNREFWISVEEDRNGYTRVARYDFIEPYEEGKNCTLKAPQSKKVSMFDEDLESTSTNTKGGSLF